MTKFQALYVAFLRLECKSNGSWRWVAARYYERYLDKIPFKGLTMSMYGNQLDGIMLCKQASEVLNIKID